MIYIIVTFQIKPQKIKQAKALEKYHMVILTLLKTAYRIFVDVR
jgi:hypothetical protein